MKVMELYNDTKLKYPKYVIIIKVGAFYEVYNEDAYIVHNLMNYKIKKMKSSNRLGFPVNSFNKVISYLNIKKINYIVIDKEIVRKKFNKNNYNKYKYYEDTEIDRIDNIYKELLSRSDENSLKYLLDRIEALL